MKTGFYFLTEQNVTELIGKRIEFRAPGAWENGNYGGVAVIKAVDLNQRFPLTVEHVSGDDLKYAFLDDHGLEPLADGKDGVTMPVVVCDTPENKAHPYTVVDGFHRTTVIQHNKDIRESLHGYVPVSRLNKSLEDRITSTVRHNMARGTHQVELSAKLVVMLKKHNWTNARIGKELGMDADEVLRLKQITGLAEAFRDEDFSKSWRSSDEG